MIGAGPLVQCSRVALGRSGGASVAIAIVVDDSASMRTQLDGKVSRFQKAIEASQQLLSSAREGDAVALVLADQFVLQARDVVYIDPTQLARAGRLIAQLTPWLQSANVTRQITN